MSEKWEYQIIQNMALTGGNKKLTPALNELGLEGWEAVSVSFKPTGSIEYVLLKRRLAWSALSAIVIKPKGKYMNKIVKSTISAVLLVALSITGTPATHSAEKSPEYKAALTQMRISKDEVKGTSWYYDKSSPKYVNANGFFLYIGTGKGYTPTLRLKIQYYGDDWLFIDSYFFNVDGKTKSIDPGYGDIETDNDSKVWEWFDTEPNKSEVELIKSIIKSKKAVMRLEGSKYYKDVTISSTQKKALQRVLTVYAGLGGKWIIFSFFLSKSLSFSESRAWN